MKNLWMMLLLPFAAVAQIPEQDFKIKGDLKLATPPQWVYLRYASGEKSTYDSVQTTDGSFKFEGKIQEPTVATLSTKTMAGEGKDAQRQFTQIYLEPGKIEVKAKDSLQWAIVTGTPGQSDFAFLNRMKKPYDDRMQMLYDEYTAFSKAGDKVNAKKKEDEMDALSDEQSRKVYGGFLEKNRNSPVALYAVKQYAGWDIDPVTIDPLFNALPEKTRMLPSAVALKDRIEIAKKTAVGNYAMDFTQPDTLGNNLSLSSLRGKYVLVDFWASWCGPCRRENPNVVKTFNKYRDRNFTVLGVSLDRPGANEKWMKAIHDDGLSWYQVSDLKFWDNAVAKQYGIRAIPQNLLIDPQGKIIAKNLNGEKLDEKLAALLN